jgi:hypothetical protein
MAGRFFQWYLAARCTHADGQRKIEARADFTESCGGQVHGYPVMRHVQTAVLQRRLNPEAALSNLLRGQAHHVEARHAEDNIDFHVHGDTIDSDDARSEHPGKHTSPLKSK